MSRYLSGSIWGVCDRCGSDTWVRVWERDYLDEPVSYICAVGCDDTAEDRGPLMTRRPTASLWRLSWRADPHARALADRHYNRQTIGAVQFVPPGRCLVLARPHAFWVTSWPLSQYVQHAWAGAWVCSAFRREPDDDALASDLIRSAVAATRWRWPQVPGRGMVTFVNPGRVRHKRDPGYCYLRAGFERVGQTAGGLIALQLLPDAMPDPVPPTGAQLELTGAAS